MAANSAATRNFRQNVRRILKEAGKSISALAADLEMSRPGLSRVLSGREDLTLGRAERIAECLNRKLPDLLIVEARRKFTAGKS